MRLLFFDFETTGLDTSVSRITEMGLVLWDVPTKTPLTTHGIYLYDETYPKQTKEIVELTGITDTVLREFGQNPSDILTWLETFCVKHQVEYLVAHNCENFDKPILMAELTRAKLDAPWLRSAKFIDTRSDIPFKKEPDSRKLKHLALDLGFINMFAHRALFDSLTTAKILSHYDLDEILAYQKIPFVTARAVVSFQDKELAKAQRYSWEKIGEKVYPKFWVKRIKENLLDLEIETCQAAGFQVVRIE